jgi:ADP-heptose:LPS heptosyltransferase
MRVLALVPGGIDQQLQFFPIINQLKHAFEAAEISVVVAPEVKDIYSLSKVVTEVVPYSFGASNSPADWANLLGIMRDREFEAVLTGTQSWSIALLLWLSGVPTRVGFAGGANDVFLTHTVPLKTDQPLSHQYPDLLKVLQVTGPLPPLTVNVPQGDITAVETLAQRANLTGGYVLAYPGTLASGEGYPPASWLAVLKDFQQRQPDLPIVLLQTPETLSTITAITDQLPGVKVIEPETQGQLAALIAGADLLMAVDSYPLYLAAALNVYALGLFASEDDGTLLAASQGDEPRLVTIASTTGQLADIDPQNVLKTIWSEAA